jgi:hypothetical protein
LLNNFFYYFKFAFQGAGCLLKNGFKSFIEY